MSKRQYKGTIQMPGAKPQTVELAVDRVSQLTKAEQAAGLQWVDDRYDPGNVLRYGKNKTSGVTNMTPAFQAAVDSTHPVKVPNGTYALSAVPIVIASNTQIVCERDVTITQGTAGQPALKGSDVNDVVIDGGRWVGADTTTAIDSGDGGVIYIDNRGTSTGNVRIVNTEVSTSANAGISCINVTGLWVMDNEISNTADYGVLASRCNDFHIDRNYIRDSAESAAANTYGISATGDDPGGDPQERCSISFNKILNFASWDGIMSHDCTKISIIGNTIENVRLGIDLTTTASNNVIDDVIVADNIIENTTSDNWSGSGAVSGGILIHGTATTSVHRAIVSNNIIRGFGNMAGSTISGDAGPIVLEYCEYFTVTGNVIEGVGSTGVTATGIYVIGDAVAGSITGNTLDGDMDGGGIRLSSVIADAITISGNTIIQDTASNNAVYTTGCTISNLVVGINATNSTAAYDDAGSTLGYGNVSVNGNFTATLTGCTTSPTGSVGFSITGDMITLEIPAISGTSNSAAATLTGLPSAITPTGDQSVIGITTDNGTDNLSRINIGNAGAITLYNVVGPTSFTSSGTKGVSACVVNYRLT